MAEIKSSIELAMERTKGLVFTEEEKRQLEEERERRIAQALILQYLRGEMSLRELERKRKEATPTGRRALDKVFVESLEMEAEALPKVLEAIESWLGKTNRHVVQKVKDLTVQWGQAVQKRKKRIKAELREDLAKRGVQGSAVEPNVEASLAWERALKELQEEFSDKVSSLREQLLQALAQVE